MKKFLLKYSATLGSLLVLIWYLYRIALNFLNPIPSEDALKKEYVKIISVREFQPHLILKGSNGEIFKANFPHDFARMKSRALGIENGKLKNLVGCEGTIGIQNIRFAFSSERRAWSIDCKSKSILFNEILKDYESTRKFDFYMDFFAVISMSALSLFFYYREKLNKTIN